MTANTVTTRLATLGVGLTIAIASAITSSVYAADPVEVSDRPLFLPPRDTNEDNVCSDPDVSGSSFGFSLPGPVVTDDGQAAWVARFVVPEWQGQLKRAPLKGGTGSTESHSIPDPSDRSVFTYNPAQQQGVAFQWDNLTKEQQQALKDDTHSSLSNTGKARLKYLRGDHSNEEQNGGPFRDRIHFNGEDSFELGDTVHSTPVIVGEPPFLYPDDLESASYSNFVSEQESRPPIMYVGANDGMIHAFNSDSGEEEFAYLPAQDVKRGRLGTLLFAHGDDRQLASLSDDGSGLPVVSDLTDTGNKDTKGLLAMGPAVADFDGNGAPDVAYLKTNNQIRVIDGAQGNASTKISLKGDKARTQKTRLTVGSFASTAKDRIFYVEQNKEKIMYVEKTASGWSNPQLAADVGDHSGANAISGFGDIDGDGQKELVYADASQDPHFLERCDVAYTSACPDLPTGSSPPSPGERRLFTPGGTPGSNEGIGYGNLFKYDGDSRDTKGLLVTDGSNNLWIYYPKPPTDDSGDARDDGGRYYPNTPIPEPKTQVKKGTQITDCNNKQAEGHCASKSPATAADADQDGELEILFPAQGQNVQNNLVAMRKVEVDSSGDVSVSDVNSEDHKPVKVRKETGIVAGGGGGGGTAGATMYDRVANLTDPDYTHEYFVDGSPTYADAYFDSDSQGDAGEWRSVIVTPFGRGDQGLFALDVTYEEGKFGDGNGDGEPDPAKFPLWQFDDEDHKDIGNIVNKVSVVRIEGDGGRWAAVFGNGFSNTKDDGGPQSDTGNASLFIVDIESGDLIRRISTKVGTEDDPTGEGRANALGPVAPVDHDGDSSVEYIYAGDQFGNLWKFDVTASEPANWSIVSDDGTENRVPLFEAESSDGTAQPITVRPAVIPHPDPARSGVMVYFGTGRYIEEDDHSQTKQTTQTLYGIWDPMDDASQNYQRQPADGEEGLLQQTIDKETQADGVAVRRVSNDSIAWSEHTGWYLDLKFDGRNNGERLVASAEVRDDKLVFNTIIPRKDRRCDKTNKGWLYLLKAENGGGASGFSVGNDDYAARRTEGGSSTGGGKLYKTPEGGTAIIKSKHPGVLDESSDQEVIERTVPISSEALGRRSWRRLE